MAVKTKKSRIFILGISGFVGMQLALYFRKKYSVVGVYFAHPIEIPDVHCFPFDFSSTDTLERMLLMTNPDIGIMAAGLNDSAICRENQPAAENINTMLALGFATAVKKARANNIHLSCAQVFDGTVPFAKEDEKNFSASVFGRTKVTAETYIRAQTMESVMIRFGKVLGMGPFNRPSLYDKLVSSLCNNQPYYVEDERVFNYMSVLNLCRAIEKVIEGEFEPHHQFYHLGGVPMRELDMAKLLANDLIGSTDLVKHKKSQAGTDSDEASSKVRDFTLNSELFENKFDWQAEDQETLLANISKQLHPAYDISDEILKTEVIPSEEIPSTDVPEETQSN